MDDPSLPSDQHQAALRGLARINRLSGVANRLWASLAPKAKELNRPMRVLDVACGGGDVAVSLQRLADHRCLPMLVDGCDLSPVAVDSAKRRARQFSIHDMHFFAHDALRDPLPVGYDAIVCTLFLHHLTNEQVVGLLLSMHRSGTQMIVVLDLRRGVLPWVATWLGTRLLTRSKVVHHDGLASVNAGWHRDELQAVAERAGWVNAKVTRSWPMRWKLEWHA